MIQKLRSAFNKRWGALVDRYHDRPGPYEREFAAHSRRVWRGYRPKRHDGGEILVEANRIPGCIVAMSYVASYLGLRERAKLVVYGKGISRIQKSVFSPFADEFLCYSAPREEEVAALFAALRPTIASKRDLENLAVDGLRVGDLIYDTYIRRWDFVTVDLASELLDAVLRETLSYLVYWRAYFERHRVRAVLVSHSIFSWPGVITRLAASRGVPVYLCFSNRLFCITESHNMRAYNEYIDHPGFFRSLPPEMQQHGLREAEARIARRFRGEKELGSHHLLRPTYLARTGTRVLEESPRLKILVASHCFSDDNHVYGDNLFPDFYEWLTFLGEISERTDYDWYVKLHPDRYPWETAHIEALARKFPRFRILPAETSHHQMVEDGIHCVLTVYGTIGFEYAALGIPVITASPWNPTVAYGFNLHPMTVAEYEKILLNLADLRLNIDIGQVYEYYYCHYLSTADNWLYDDYSASYEEVCKLQGPGGRLAYRQFLAEFSDEKHRRILDTVDRFVRSRDYCLRITHLAGGPVSASDMPARQVHEADQAF